MAAQHRTFNVFFGIGVLLAVLTVLRNHASSYSTTSIYGSYALLVVCIVILLLLHILRIRGRKRAVISTRVDALRLQGIFDGCEPGSLRQRVQDVKEDFPENCLNAFQDTSDLTELFKRGEFLNDPLPRLGRALGAG